MNETFNARGSPRPWRGHQDVERERRRDMLLMRRAEARRAAAIERERRQRLAEEQRQRRRAEIAARRRRAREDFVRGQQWLQQRHQQIRDMETSSPTEKG